LVLAATLLAALVVFLARRSPLPEVAHVTPVASHAPIFAAWVKFEPPAARANTELAEHFVDFILQHQVFQLPPQGLPTARARELMLDDDHLLLSSGRRLWAREFLNEPGLAGKFCYLHSGVCFKRLFDVQFFVDGKPLVIYENQYGIQRFPSHTEVKYYLGTVNVDESIYITYDDRAVCT